MLKKIHLIVKYLFQIFLYLFETLGIAVLCTIFITDINPFTNCFEFIESVTVFYALYQIIIYNILQQFNDIKKDEYLALSTLYKLTRLYIITKNDIIKQDILSKLEYQLDSATFNDNNVRREYLNIKEIINSPKKNNLEIIDYKIIYFDHLSEEAILGWKYSILLRLLK